MRGAPGNIAWKLSRMMSQRKPGDLNRRLCVKKRQDGQPCRGIAVNGSQCCYRHGGQLVIARKRLHRRKLRYGAWTQSESERRDEQQRSLAEEFDFPVGGDV